MDGCGVCGRTDEFLFTCRHCDGFYCDDHHPPEDHQCDELPEQTVIFGAEPFDPPSVVGEAAENARTQATTTFIGQFDIDDWLPSTRVVLAIVLVPLIIALTIGAIAFLEPHISRVFSPNLGEAVSGPGGDAGGGGAADAVNQTEVERLLAARLNEFRAAQGVGAVEYDPALAQIAAYHSEDMAERNYTGHVGPEGETVQDRFDRFGYACRGPGELVLFTVYGRDILTPNGTLRFENESDLATGAIKLWRQSPQHREALMTEAWERVGFGVHVTADDRVYVTLNAC